MRWLEVPVAVLSALLARLPRLQARERIYRVQDVSLGTGALREGDAARLRAQLEAAANGPRPRPTLAEQRAMAAALGIRVVEEKVS